MTDNFQFDDARLAAFQRGHFMGNTLIPVLQAWRLSSPDVVRDIQQLTAGLEGCPLSMAEAQQIVSYADNYWGIFNSFLEFHANAVREIQATLESQNHIYLSVLELGKQCDAVLGMAQAIAGGGAENG